MFRKVLCKQYSIVPVLITICVIIINLNEKIRSKLVLVCNYFNQSKNGKNHNNKGINDEIHYIYVRNIMNHSVYI